MNNILYSFRRCPFAIRARLAISYAQQQITLREVDLKEKPQQMLALSPKETVPVLQLGNGEVLDESLDIMVWALENHDPDGWLQGNLTEMLNLIDKNDFEFKGWLDKYKYADRYPTYPACYYRTMAEEFIIRLESRLNSNCYLFGERISLADIAIFPFVRQFAAVDKDYFQQCPYPFLKIWLNNFNDSTLFKSVMNRYPIWQESTPGNIFPVTA